MDLEINNQFDFFKEVKLDENGALIVSVNITKSGSTQVAAGALVGELWTTLSHATLPDGVVLKGI